MNLTITELLAALTDLRAIAHQYRMTVVGHFRGRYTPDDCEHIIELLDLEGLEFETLSEGPSFWEFTVQVNGLAVTA